MKGKNNALAVTVLLPVVIALAGCAAIPVKPGFDDTVFQQPAPVVQRAAIDALIATGFDITESEPLYAEGYRPRKRDSGTSCGGETVGIWLEAVEPSKTGVRVATAMSSYGIMCQKSWNGEILDEMQKALGKRQ